MVPADSDAPGELDDPRLHRIVNGQCFITRAWLRPPSRPPAVWRTRRPPPPTSIALHATVRFPAAGGVTT
jgi:hypothetical protein